MKVYDVLVESDFKVVKASNGFNIIGPNGQVVGTEKIPGTARAKAAELNKGPKISVGSNGKLDLAINGQKFSGTPNEIVKQLEQSDLAPKGTVNKVLAKAKSAAGKTVKFLISTKIFAFVGAAQLVPIWITYHNQRVAMKAMWEAVYPKGHPFEVGSSYYDEVSNKTMQPYLNSAYTASGAVAVDVLVSIAKGGKAVRVLRMIYGATPPAPPWGLVIKGLVFAATEGALFALTWAIQKYGPDFFTAMANDKLTEYFNMTDEETVTVDSPNGPEDPTKEIVKKVADEKKKTSSSSDKSKTTFGDIVKQRANANKPKPEFDFGR